MKKEMAKRVQLIMRAISNETLPDSVRERLAGEGHVEWVNRVYGWLTGGK